VDSFAIARLRARRARAQHAGDISDGFAAVKKALSEHGFQIRVVPPEDPTLDGMDAKLSRGLSTVLVRNNMPQGEQASHAAHELGHLDLHRPNEACAAKEAAVDDTVPRALARVETYGPRERRELQANVYAREFLLPRDLARSLFLAEGQSGSVIATRLGLPPALVRRQLIDCLLLPDVAEPQSRAPERPVKLDDSQKEAATWPGPALLVEAGPGAGKTRTLVARVEHLVDGDTAPSAILALTFSNKAAVELTARVAKRRPDAATEIWSGTFHAFGLELLRRHYDRVGLGPDVRPIDRAQAVELLEDRLPVMGLKHFHDLRNPGEKIKPILATISRAKDELVDSADFRALAERAFAAARSEKEIENAEKALETAQVYAAYEEALRAAKVVDFGDLVMLPTLLLKRDKALRSATRSRHREILVDEYQDVNRASAELLACLYGDGTRIWVVGDARQSIYRWRGASSINMARFERDFVGGERRPLKWNYRSTEHIVGLSRSFAKEMIAGRTGLAYEVKAYRTDPGSSARLLVGFNDEAESELLARESRLLEQQGVPLSRQVVLAPTNARLDSLSDQLGRRLVPALHLGSFFEREEVRDVLSVLALVAEANGGALARVAALRDVQVRAPDITRIVEEARKRETPLVDLLRNVATVPGLTAEGSASLSRLGQRLEGITGSTPAFDAAAAWLLEQSGFLRDMAASTGVAGDLSRAALRRLLDFLDQRELDGRPLSAARALRRVRTVVLLADDRDLREPDLGDDVPAIRLMTIHAAKGLEFQAVHVLGLHKGGLPGRRQHGPCPPPAGLVAQIDDETAHMEEEECAFFVAISRAEDHLRLYHTEKAVKQKRDRSPFLGRLGFLQTVHLGEIATLNVNTPPSLDPAQIDDLTLHDVREYETCPLRLAYRRLLSIRGRRYESPFLRTSGVIYEVVDRVSDLAASSAGFAPAAMAAFTEVWAARGPVGQLEGEYLRLARGRIEALVVLAQGFGPPEANALSVIVPSGRVAVHRPLTRRDGVGFRVRFYDAGRADSQAAGRLTAGLMFAAARAALGPITKVEIAHLADGKVVPIDRAPSDTAEDLIRAGEILAAARAGHLPPQRSMRVCIRCPHFFFCPATGARRTG
jgi:superfamily I DNA/RNA helicase